MRRVVVVKDIAVIYENIDEKLNLRDIITSEPVGSVLEVIPCDLENAGFYKVKADGKEGYINKNFVEEIDEEFTEEEKKFLVECIIYRSSTSLWWFQDQKDIIKNIIKKLMGDEYEEVFRSIMKNIFNKEV